MSFLGLNLHKTLLLLTLALYFLVRLPFLPLWMNYSDDQGKHLLEISQLLKNRDIPLIGPPVSLEVEGKHFFHGPYEYYFLMPWFWLSNGDPLFLTVATILCNALGVIFLYIVLCKTLSSIEAALVTAAFFALPLVVHMTSFIWNPTLLLPCACALLFLIVSRWKSGRYSHLLMGIVTGVGILLHYQALVWVVIYGYFLIKRKAYGYIPWYLVGLGLALAPMILFEVRHDFFNVKTLSFILSHNQNNSSLFSIYYTIAFLPFGLYALIYFLKEKLGVDGHIIKGVAMVILLWGLWQHVLTLASWSERWNYTYAQKAVDLIEAEAPQNFNVANLLTGDTRAHALRFLLSKNDLNAAGVTEYASVERLFVLAQDEARLTQDPPWEITEFNGCVIKKYPLDSRHQYHLFMLQKNC